MADRPHPSAAVGATPYRLFTFVLNGPRSRLQAIGSTIVGVVLEVVAMAILGSVGATSVLGIPGPLAVAIAAAVGIFAGATASCVVAVAGALSYYAFLGDFGRSVHPAVLIVSSLLWIVMAVLIAFGGSWVRKLLAARLKAQARTDELYRDLEQSLLPASGYAHPRLDVATYYSPGERGLRLGGDFFDLATLEDGSLALVIGDVSGHGPRAAALGAMLRGAWRGVVNEASPGATAHTLDRIVWADCAADGCYATALFAWIDDEGETLRLLSAGHPPPLLIDEEAIEVELQPLPPLGFAADAPRWRLRSVALPAAWTLLFYTDGLTDIRLRPGTSERVGVSGLITRLAGMDSSLDGHGLAGLAGALAIESGAEPNDDIAAIVVHKRRRSGQS